MLQGVLYAGAAVTQATLIDYLLEAASEAAQKTNGNREVEQCGPDKVYTALAHHLQRIAGNPVRLHSHCTSHLAMFMFASYGNPLRLHSLSAVFASACYDGLVRLHSHCTFT